MTLRSGYADISIGQLHWRQAGPWPGQGEPLLLLHQPPRSSRVYRRLMERLAQQGLSVLAVDLPGFGESCDLPAGSSMVDIAGHGVEALDALGFSRAHVFGLHSGNKVAAALAMAHPDRAASFMLAGMTHSIILDAERRNVAMREYVANKPAVDPIVNPDADPEAWADLQVDRALCRGTERLYEANYRFDLGETLARIRVPSLVLELAVPAEDRLGRQAELICQRMTAAPSARWQRIPMNDVELLQRRPELLAQALATFIGSL